MLSPEWIVIIVFTLLETLMAFILNIGIVLADSKSWRQGQKWNPSDLIHLIIGLVNIVLQSSLTGQGIVFVFFLPAFVLKEVYLPAIFLTMSLIYCSYWLSAWLCVYYCISITNLPHQVFVWLKKTFSSYLPHLLLLSMVASILITLPTIWTVEVKVIKESLGNGSHDSATISAAFSFSFAYIQTANVLGCFLPFLLILVSIVVTVSSLLKHMWKVKQNDSGFGGSKFRAHINAIKTMILFLILFIIFFIDVNVFFMMGINTNNPVTIAAWVIFISFPLAESIIIIQASAKLRKFLFGKILNGNRWGTHN
ncbi:taste receptor type 2 member 4-like [Rana temporaria]|uniref:taste receptor type 2 member 4-like n=1 Tax=Rana temporaria TaxID=8407 RepID=UPI001AAD91F5|nr:taste receptor type 2 member 4-like [Rana temporaria]